MFYVRLTYVFFKVASTTHFRSNESVLDDLDVFGDGRHKLATLMVLTRTKNNPMELPRVIVDHLQLRVKENFELRMSKLVRAIVVWVHASHFVLDSVFQVVLSVSVEDV